MKAFTWPIGSIVEEIEERAVTGISDIVGVSEAAQAHLMYSVFQSMPLKIIVAAEEKNAQEFLNDLRLFDKDVVYFPPKDLIFYQSDLNGNLLSAQRQECFRAMLAQKSLTIVTTIDALMEKRPDILILRQNVINIDGSSEIDTVDFAVKLNAKPQPFYDNILKAIDSFTGGTPQAEDLTLMVVARR